MTAVKDDKRAPPDLERVINSDRYKVVKFLGRGCWGSVYEAEDTKLGRTVAIKVMDPTETAKRQMQERKLDELAAMKNEALELQACANIVPRVFDEDKNGVPFIVMPKYDRFFSDVIAKPPIKGGKSWTAFGEEEQLKTGFFVSDIIRFSEDIIKGIAEIHSNYNIAHCDIKPDNLAMDKDGRILISDMGTSTFASLETTSPRDNMGYAYTRSPKLFVEGTHPKKSSDVFALGSLMYKLFTGEYIFEKELNTEKGVKEFMTSLVNQISFGADDRKVVETFFSPGYSQRIEDKLKGKEIPVEFKAFIRDCLHEHYYDGKDLKRGFENVVKTYFENRIKKSKFDEFKAKARNNLLGAFGCGTIVAGLLLGGSWLSYLGKRPDFSNRPDIETKLDTRAIEKSEVVLEVERKYGREFEIVGNEMISPYLEEHLMDRYGDKTLVDKITRAWLNSVEDTGAKLLPDELFMRFNRIRPFASRDQPVRNVADEIIRAMVTHYLGACQTSENVIDLEDALTVTRVGRDALYKAQKASGSTEFNAYISAKDEKGQFIIQYQDQVFLKRLLYRVTQAVPQIVRLAPGSSQSEQDGKSHEDKK